MKIALFTEIYDCGGVDTFILNLVNSWPVKDDSFVIIANSNYPGLRIIEEKMTRSCEVIRHKVPIYSNLLSRNIFLKIVREATSPVLRYLLLFYNVVAFRKILLKTNSDVLMVINGGYPGGDSCRAATISWGMFSGKSKSIHNFHSLPQKPRFYLRLQEYAIDWLLCWLTSQFVTVSKAAAESISLRPAIFKRHITSYIYNGIKVNDTSSLMARNNIKNEIGIDASSHLCLMLSTYDKGKGHFFLLDAFKKVITEIPDAHLLICGYGSAEAKNKVARYAEELRLDGRVHLMGFRTDISHLLANTDVLVVPSQAYESFGITSVEAMAFKVPVVATDVGGIPEVVVNNEGGYCVNRHDVDSYARCIVKLLKDGCLRREQGDKGYKRYREHFTAKVMASKYAKMIYMWSNIAMPINATDE